jgi:hypothetical protein
MTEEENFALSLFFSYFPFPIICSSLLYLFPYLIISIEYTQKNGAISKVNKKFISHLTRAQRTLSAAKTVQVSHSLPAVRFTCLLRGREASFHAGVAVGKGFLCAPF